MDLTLHAITLALQSSPGRLLTPDIYQAVLQVGAHSQPSRMRNLQSTQRLLSQSAQHILAQNEILFAFVFLPSTGVTEEHGNPRCQHANPYVGEQGSLRDLQARHFLWRCESFCLPTDAPKVPNSLHEFMQRSI